jgi:hypothetical protein
MSNKEKDELKQRIQVWLQLEKEKTRLREELKERDKQQKAIEPTILTAMEKAGHNVVATGNDAIKFKSVKTYQSVSKDLIMKTLAKLLKDEKKAGEMTQAIYDSRTLTEKKVLEHKALKDKE